MPVPPSSDSILANSLLTGFFGFIVPKLKDTNKCSQRICCPTYSRVQQWQQCRSHGPLQLSLSGLRVRKGCALSRELINLNYGHHNSDLWILFPPLPDNIEILEPNLYHSSNNCFILLYYLFLRQDLAKLATLALNSDPPALVPECWDYRHASPISGSETALQHNYILYFLFFCATEVWNQGFPPGRHSTTWATSPVIFTLVTFQIGF
jgi:hypothetical protein